MSNRPYPKYELGDLVDYSDHHNRVFGNCEVLAVEMSWRYKGRPPLIIYTVYHPSYRNNRIYISEDSIIERI